MRRVPDDLLDLMSPAERRRALKASRDAHSVDFVAEPIPMGSAASTRVRGRVVIRSSSGVLSIPIDGHFQETI